MSTAPASLLTDEERDATIRRALTTLEPLFPPSDEDYTNSKRARVAQVVLDVYAHHQGLQGDGYATVIGDLICDLMHFCDEREEEEEEADLWNAGLNNGYMHYSAEFSEEQESEGER